MNVPEPEKIVSAAIKAAGRVYLAPTHIQAFMAFYQDESVPTATKSAVMADERQVEMDGFVTNTGRYVDRKEAFKIASAAKQLAPPWTDPNFPSDFTQSDEPPLDSGWIESYARPDVEAIHRLVEQAQVTGNPAEQRLLYSIAEGLRRLL